MNRIKELRKNLGLYQRELAERLNVAPNTLSYWEKGTYDPDNKSLIEMSKIFSVNINYILGVTDDPTPLRVSDFSSPLAAVQSGAFQNEMQGLVNKLVTMPGNSGAVSKNNGRAASQPVPAANQKDIIVLARNTEGLTEEDRAALIKTLENTVDTFLRIARKQSSETGFNVIKAE